MPRRATTEDMLLVHGVNPVRELLRSGHPVHRLLVRARRDPQAVAAERAGVRVDEVDRQTLDRLVGHGHHQGIAAEAAPFRYVEPEIVARESRGVALVLDGVQDPRNLGAIVRTARAVGTAGVLLPRDRSAGVTPAVVAASAGHVFGVPVGRVTNVARALDLLKAAGWWVVGLEAGGDGSLFDAELPDRVCLVLGGEGEGLRPLVARHCDWRVGLPMDPAVESLNVSVAAGIALYELGVRRRRPTGGRP